MEGQPAHPASSGAAQGTSSHQELATNADSLSLTPDLLGWGLHINRHLQRHCFFQSAQCLEHQLWAGQCVRFKGTDHAFLFAQGRLRLRLVSQPNFFLIYNSILVFI